MHLLVLLLIHFLIIRFDKCHLLLFATKESCDVLFSLTEQSVRMFCKPSLTPAYDGNWFNI